MPALPPTPGRARSRPGAVLAWSFRNRRTGGVTIVQRPNLPLALFLGFSVLRRLAGPEGGSGAFLAVAAALALTWWAGWEVLDGVNPWRRTLGAVVLVVTLAGLATRLLG